LNLETVICLYNFFLYLDRLTEKIRWNYICLFVDVFNRQIVGHSVGRKKNAELVYRALAGIKVNLKRIKIFHSDRGSEFNNHIIDQALDAFQIKWSLSKKRNCVIM
jgi:putative transposase